MDALNQSGRGGCDHRRDGDVTTAAQNLDLVLQDMQRNEQRVVDEMTRFLARFDAGNPVDLGD